MSALIATLCCIFTATGWAWESLRHLKQMEKAAKLSREMVEENLKLRQKLNNEQFRSSVRIADLEEKIKDLESEKSNLNKELTEAKNKLKTACEHINTLRWMVSDLEQGKPIIRGIAK